jgi:DNA repair exonuclease SbcCD nuclease subunit
MKIAILNDTHLGVRNGSEVFLNSAEKFYSEVFFPYLLKNKIKNIIHLGDYYDHRKFVNYKVLARDRSMFISKLDEYDICMDIIPGNHDVYHKNSNELCSLTEILRNFSKKIKVHIDPVVLNYDGLKIALCPWISPENEKSSLEFIAKGLAPILMGHFDFSGFEMMKGGSISHGYSEEIVKNFEMVLSGHFHTKSSRGNIHYLGTQFETTWSDCNDPKFFHVLDTNTRELTPVKNPNILFHRISYDDSDSNKVPNWLGRFNFDHVKDSFVKVVVANKGNPIIFDKFIDKIQSVAPFEIKIVETFSEFTSEEVQDNLVALEDTTSLLNTYIDAVETDLDKNKLKKRLQELYAEAQSMEIV